MEQLAGFLAQFGSLIPDHATGVLVDGADSSAHVRLSADFAPGPGSAPATKVVQRLVPKEAIVRPIGAEPAAEVIAFVDDGFLSGLELVSYADVSPQEWPDLSRFERRV